MAIHVFRSLKVCAIVCLAAATGVGCVSAAPPEPGWSKQIIPTGQERAVVKSTPIELRPYRPLHVYGNTVRRWHYRGTPLPAPRDVVSTAAGAIR